jgi:hypothetical protein
VVQNGEGVLAAMERCVLEPGASVSAMTAPAAPGKSERFSGGDRPRYIVPEGMLNAATVAYNEVVKSGQHIGFSVCHCLEAAIQWLAENPLIPTDEQRAELSRLVPYEDSGNGKILSVAVVEWQRRMFLAPEPPIPDEVSPLMWGSGLLSEAHNRAVIKAFELGKRSASK